MGFKTIYPQSISGKYRTIKNYSLVALLLIYFFSSWIRWDRGAYLPNQAIFMDLPNRKAYLFFIEIWPEELYYLAGILILAALGLFFVTSLYGRIWCGYTCPHTVFVDLFRKVEYFFQGDRNAHIKLDHSPWSRDKFLKKLYTHVVWLLLGFSFAFGWVCYFYDAPSLLRDIGAFNVHPAGLCWLVGLTASTYLFAGWVRERVCNQMCPYGRFQSAMLDKDSSVVTYHNWRGEPRGSYNPDDKSLGDCIDCNKCVVVCPQGIDIRDGLQMECIGCGLCIDACNSVMEKLARPLYLIGYDSITSTYSKQHNLSTRRKIFSAKTTLFAIVFVIISGALLYALSIKAPYNMTIAHDRGSLFTVLPDGSVRNRYTIKIFNRSAASLNLKLQVLNLPKAKIKIQGLGEYQDYYMLSIAPEEEKEVTLFIKVDERTFSSDQNLIYFSVSSEEPNYMKTIKSIFVGRN